MTARRPTPVESYDPKLVAWLVEAAGGEVRLQPTTDEERRRLPGRVLRLRALKRQMAVEGHPLARQVAAVTVKIDSASGDLVLASLDCGLEALGRAEPRAATVEPAAALPRDPLTEFLPAPAAEKDLPR